MDKTEKVSGSSRKGGNPSATSDDVAKIARVSRSTVSRAFTPGASISAKARERVLAAAAQLNYSPNPLARSLISRRTDTVGLVLGQMENPFYHTVFNEFLLGFQRRGLRVMCHIAQGLNDVETGIRSMLRYNADGIIVTSSAVTSDAVIECKDAGIPVIMFNRTLDNDIATSIQTDNSGGGAAVADLLFNSGYERIAYIHGVVQSSTDRARFSGFRQRLAELGLQPPLEEFGEYMHAGAREAIKRLMLAGQAPDAVFCANDIMAFGAIDGIRADLGLRVPEDVAIVGFDDVPMADWSYFNLTTVRQRRTQMIDATVHLLDKMMKDPSADPENVVIPGQLILRGTTLSRRFG